MTGIAVMGAVTLLVLAALVAFYRYSVTPAWTDSETRRAILNVLVAVGPLLGMHYRPPRPPLPAITAPGEEPDDLDLRLAPEDQPPGEGSER